MEILIIILLIAVFTAVVLFFALQFFMLFWGPIFGAPFVRSRKEKLNTMLDLAEIRPGEKVLELGSGDGELVIRAAQKGAQAVGVEINPLLVWYSRRRIRKLRLPSAKIIFGNFKKYPLSRANIIFMYLRPSTIAKIKEKLGKETSPGTRIVSNTFTIPCWKYILEKDKIFLYENGR